MKLMNNICKFRITLRDFPYNCCNAQKYCPPVLCPYNYLECPIYSQEYTSDTSIPHPKKDEDIVRTTCITNEDVEITG